MKHHIAAALITVSASAASAETEFCAHEDAAAILDQFMFSTVAETEAFLAAFADQNTNHSDIASKFEAASKSGQKDLQDLAEKARAKAALSIRIEEELRCRMGS